MMTMKRMDMMTNEERTNESPMWVVKMALSVVLALMVHEVRPEHQVLLHARCFR